MRVAQAGSELLAIDHDHEHHNSVAAAEAGVGAPVIDYLPDAGLMVVGYLDGRTFTDADLRSGEHLDRGRRCCPAAARRPAVRQRLRHVRDPAGVPRQSCSEHGFRLPDRYLEFVPQVERIRRAFAVRAEPTVPCNNDLLAGNFIDDGEKIWLIDYEYSGNNEA